MATRSDVRDGGGARCGKRSRMRCCTIENVETQWKKGVEGENSSRVERKVGKAAPRRNESEVVRELAAAGSEENRRAREK